MGHCKGVVTFDGCWGTVGGGDDWRGAEELLLIYLVGSFSWTVQKMLGK